MLLLNKDDVEEEEEEESSLRIEDLVVEKNIFLVLEWFSSGFRVVFESRK